jgi:hypothetical protein
MSHPYVPAALARDRQNMLLAEGEAARLAKQARTLRRLLTRWAESASAASSSRALSTTGQRGPTQW